MSLRAARREKPVAANCASKGALVIGGDYRGLGVVRSLGRRGIPVWVLTDEHRVAATSRYALHSLTWPGESESERLSFLLKLATRHHLAGWTIFPTGDETVALLARHAETLSENFISLVPPWDVTRWAYDKQLTHQLAAEVGVDFPRTYYPHSREDVATLDCAFPVILKPAVKHRMNDFTRAKAWQVNNLDQLVDRYNLACQLVDPESVMVQEIIPGGGDSQVSYVALANGGMPLAEMTAKRVRQYPMDFGRFSTLVETAELPEVKELARRLIAACQYTGLIEVEFKYDGRDGRYKLLDLNPRVWGWHTLAQRAGIDFPYFAWKLAHGETIPNVNARSHTRWIRFLPDAVVAAHEILGGRLSLNAYRQSLSGPLEFAIFAVDDPRPALFDLPFQIVRFGKHVINPRGIPNGFPEPSPDRGVRGAPVG